MADVTPIAIAIFAKAPIAGYAKTRLISRLGARGAANLQGQLIAKTIATARVANLGPVTLWCTPTARETVFEDLAARANVSLFTQTEGDLGQRMDHALRVMTSAMPTLLVGTDCPALEPRHFIGCAEILKQGRDAVFIPVEDGGYILVGLRRPAPALFRDMAWGSARVMAATRARARALGLSWQELPALWDLDVAADYDRARALGLIAAADVCPESSPDRDGAVS